MAGESKIEWTDATWNPTRGCSRVSPGCGDATGGGCYAMKMAHRFSGPGGPYEGLTRIGKRGVDWAGKAVLVPSMLDVPLRWRKPRHIFVDSMSDLFHESLSNEQIAAVFGIMAACPQHTFQVLTKRAERMPEWFAWLKRNVGEHDPGHATVCGIHAGNFGANVDYLGIRAPWPLPNVWLGVSAEDQQRADERIPHLLATPAAVRFVSVEPMLGPVDLTPWLHAGRCKSIGPAPERFRCGLPEEHSGHPHSALQPTGVPWFGKPQLSWVICGSESGHGARPMQIEWAESLRDQCAAASVAFFTKQIANAHDKKGGDPQHWPGGPWPREFPRVSR